MNSLLEKQYSVARTLHSGVADWRCGQKISKARGDRLCLTILTVSWSPSCGVSTNVWRLEWVAAEVK
ncbi:hypothetical protein SUGI_1146330 [Cryptomeria japonica]|nr:hypothetical protein SUGI_1146330 [Cryptomeria japonica]